MINGYLKLLRIFGSLPHRIKILDEIIKHTAVVTHNCYKNAVMRSTLEQVNKITALLQLRTNVYYLYNSVVDAMNGLPKEQRLLLILLYVRNADKDNICKFFNFSLRTLYRRATRAGENFVQALVSQGIDKEWLINNVKSFLEGNLHIR